MNISNNKKLTNFVLNRITQELGDKEVNPYGNELWIIDKDTKSWYVQLEHNGTLWFNQKMFHDLLRIFCFSDYEKKYYIKLWVETLLEVKVTSVSRKNTNYEYIIDGIIRNSNNKWSLKKRYGFGYDLVKKYIILSEVKKIISVEDFSRI